MVETTISKHKEHLLEELREFKSIASYLGAWFCLFATMKSLVLIQVGVNDFVHGYIVALVEALALGKIVLLTKNIPILNWFKDRPLVYAAIYQAATLSIIVFCGGQLEDHFFSRKTEEAPLKEQLGMILAHLIALFMVFYSLFIARGLDKALGHGKLVQILKSVPESESSN